MKDNIKQVKFSILIVFVFIALNFFFTSKFSYAETTLIQTQDRVDENSQQIRNIENQNLLIKTQMQDLKDNYKILYDGAKNQNDQLSNQISFASYIVGIFSLIFTILGIVLAWYISRQYEKIKKIKDTVGETKKYIDNHNNELYKKIKRDDTLELLNRLKEVPEDISNISFLLFSRNLLDEDYLRLKEPYWAIKEDNNRVYNDSYILLLMQHFPYQSLKDPSIKNEMINNIDVFRVNSMFLGDIKKFFSQTLKYLEDFGITEEQNKELIKKLFYFYSKSKFNNNDELKKIVKDLLKKHKLNNSSFSNIAIEQAPNDTIYVDWLKSIF